jgi:hypothetical protein
MIQANPRRHIAARLTVTLLAALFCMSVAADSAFAQGGGFRRAGGGKKSSDPKQPPTKQDKPPPLTPGQQNGTIISYKVAKDADIEKGIAGYLTVKSFEKNAKPLKLTVFKEGEDGDPSVIVKLGEYQFEDIEDYGDIFWKGLYVTAGWGYKDENAKVKVKELRTLDFNGIDIKGKIDKIEDDVVTIKAVPKNDQDWPHLAGQNDKPPQTTKAGTLPPAKKIRNLKIKLKNVEDVSKLFDAENEEASLSSFEAGQAIEGTIVFSAKFGMIVKLAPPGVSGESTAKAPPDDDDKPGGGRQAGGRPPRGQGPRGGG